MEWLIYLTNKVNCLVLVVSQFFATSCTIPSTIDLKASNRKDNTEVIQTPCKDVECLIMQMEGFSAKPVYCGGHAIGYGRAVYKSKIEYYKNHPVTRQVALNMLREDLDKKRNQVKQLFITTNLNSNQIDALASIAYNTGFYSFKKKVLVHKISNGKKVSEQDFINTVSPSYQKKYRGLVKRRKAEYKLYCQ